MDSGSIHRPIELQSPEDFTYLIDNVRRAAADSINAAFPPVEGHEDQEDELRVRIEQLVYSYIKQTFTLAAPNLTINGLPASPDAFLSGLASEDGAAGSRGPEEMYEPFNGRRRQRVEELAREEEDLLREIAALKRKVPAAAAAQYAEQLRASVRADDEALEAARAKVLEGRGSGSGSGDKKMLLDGGGGLERQDAVEEAYEGAVKALGRLKREMPATVAKMERARVAGEYVVSGR